MQPLDYVIGFHFDGQDTVDTCAEAFFYDAQKMIMRADDLRRLL